MRLVKKILKWTGIWLLSLFAIILIAVIVLLVKNKSFIGPLDKQLVEYLNRNKTVLDRDVVYTQALFDNETYESNMILLGESHGIADVQAIDKALFIHLNKKTGLRYYLAEMDSIRTIQLNTFLSGSEKDTILLKQFVSGIALRIPQQAGRELYQKWSDMYDYNQTLADSFKIRVIGVDTDFEGKSPIARDSAMINNFMSIIKREGLENERFYGLFGIFHVFQDGMNANNFRPFAARLKSRGFSIKSIACLYIESETYLPPNDQIPSPPSGKMSLFNMDGPMVLAKGINSFKKASEKNTITLFNLTQNGSPGLVSGSSKYLETKVNFVNQHIFPYDEHLAMSDFIQYIIFVRNSEAISPMY
jgi:hypothetical protein